MSNKYTNEYIIGTIQEVAELSALEISKNYALDRLAENGVVTQEEVSSMYSLAQKVLFEGSEDFIPETLELPEDGSDMDMGEEDMGEEQDLDISQLEGIVLPDAEGNQYVIQNGMIIPYGEEDDMGHDMGQPAEGGDAAPVDATPIDAAPVAEEPVIDNAPDAATDMPAAEEEEEEEEKPVQESTEAPVGTEVINESETFSTFSGNSAIVQKLIDDIKFR